MKSFLHHFEYENSGINPEIIERLIKIKKHYITIMPTKEIASGQTIQH